MGPGGASAPPVSLGEHVLVRPLAAKIASYDAPSTDEIARRVGLPVEEIIRFDGNTSPQLLPSTRVEALTEELARIHTYPHGGYPRLERAIAEYARVAPENIVLGAGADDLILLVTRAFAGSGDRVAIANDPTYPMFPIAVWVAGAEIGDDDPLPSEQPDRRARPASRGASARRRRGVFRVLGRDGDRPDRGRRDRHPHLLEGVRSRGCARRLRRRGSRGRGGAQ